MVNRAKWMEMQIELWCAFLIDFEKIPFPSQCENITHARHLTLRHSSVSYIKLPWVGEDSSTGCITSHIFIWLLFPVMFPGLALFLLSSECHQEDRVHVAKCGSRPFPGVELVAQDCRHQSGTMKLIWGKSLSMHSDSFIPHGEIRHSPGSELEYLTALSLASTVINACFKSNPLKSAKNQLYAQHPHRARLLICFIPLDILVLSPFLQHRPWAEKYKREPRCPIFHLESDLMDVCSVIILK